MRYFIKFVDEKKWEEVSFDAVKKRVSKHYDDPTTVINSLPLNQSVRLAPMWFVKVKR